MGKLKKIIPVAVFILAAIFFSVNLGLIQGQLSGKVSITNPQAIEISAGDVHPDDLVTVELFGDDGKNADLPQDWQIKVTYFIAPGVETTVASTNSEDASILISREKLGNYTFKAPHTPALYGIFLIDGEDQLQASLAEIKVTPTK